MSLPAGTSLIQEGWEVVMEDVFGEFLLRTYLETGLPRLSPSEPPVVGAETVSGC